MGTYAGTFSRVLRGFQGLKVEVRTLAVSSRAAKTGQIPVTAFRQAASNMPPAVAYVSFAGVPADVDKFLSAGTQGGPGMFVFDPWGTTNWLAALKKGLVRCVVVPRPDVSAPSGGEIAGEPATPTVRTRGWGFPALGCSGSEMSSAAVQMLKACGVDRFHSVDVLQDPEIRQGIKEYANWPTIPQLYVNGEFVGGADIMREMYQSGELQKMLETAKA